VTRAASKRQISISYPLTWMLLALGICLPISSYGWGANGHRFITDTAVEELPPPLKSFFLTYKTLFKNLAATEPAGNHYIDIDYYPEFFSHTFPHDLDVLNAKYGSSVVTYNGLGPWTALSNYNTLRASFAAARNQTDWTNLLTIAGATAHYLEDLHNPMHLATNYNGQYTDQAGLHSRYETTLINNRISAGLTLATNQAACLYYPSRLDAIFNDIDLVYPENAPLLAADLAAYAAAGDRTSVGYYQHLWDDGCSSFTPVLMQKGADMVASALYSAWRDAGFPRPFGAITPPLVTLRFVSLDNTGCRLSILGDAGQRLDLYTTTNLSNWTWQVSVTNLDGHIEIVVPPPTGQLQRFYRAVVVQ
jgi:hypothetical protein